MTRVETASGDISPEQPEISVPPLNDKETEGRLMQDESFTKVLAKKEQEFLSYWRKFLSTAEGRRLKKDYPKLFDPSMDTDSIALDVARDVVLKNGYDVFRHNQKAGKQEWKYGLYMPYESVKELFVIEVKRVQVEADARVQKGKLKDELGLALAEQEEKRTPIYGRYETKDVGYDIAEEGGTQIEKWNNGLILANRADEIVLTLTGEEHPVGWSFLITDFPTGPINVFIHREVRPKNKQALIFSFQEKGGKVSNYEMVLPNDDSVYKLSYDKTLLAIAKEEVAYRRKQKERGIT